MKKIIVYRALGWISLIYGAAVYFGVLVYEGFAKGVLFSFPEVFGLLLASAFNVFLWAGFILLLRADRNEDPHKKSIWKKFILLYGIFAGVVIIAGLVTPLLLKT